MDLLNRFKDLYKVIKNNDVAVVYYRNKPVAVYNRKGELIKVFDFTLLPWQDIVPALVQSA